MTTESHSNQPSGESRRPRHERQPRKATQLEERDRALLRLFTTHRLIPTSVFPVLLPSQFPSRLVLQRRLRDLFDAGYLARPPAQYTRKTPGRRGTAEHVYALGAKGARELARLGVSLPRIDFDQKARDLKLTGLDHPLLVTKILACVSACVRERGLSCAELAGDGQLSIDTNAVDGPRQFRVTVRPDAFALIKHPERRERVALFFEADRGTMPLSRSEFVQSSFRKKVLAYNGLWMDRERLEELGAETFLVLTLTEREARMRSLVERVGEMLKPATAGVEPLFWFASEDSVDLSDPSSLLFGEIWESAEHPRERGSIF